MKEIPLTQGRVAFVDDEDFERVSKLKWYAAKNNKNFYAVTCVKNQPNSTRSYSRLYLHNFLIGQQKGCVVDHVNGNTMDNRRANLRLVSARQNVWNSSVRHDSASGHKCVLYRKERKKYSVRVRVFGRQKAFGSFENLEDAIKRRDEVLMEVRGELPHRKEFVGT